MTDHPLSLLEVNVVYPSLPSGTASMPTDGPEKVLDIGSARCTCSNSGAVPATSAELRGTDANYRHGVTIDMLPDDVLLEIFNLGLCNSTKHPFQHTRDWQRLVHVCQRWRQIIFASPRRLDLHLSCSYGTPVRQNLVCWPVILPITVDYSGRLGPVYRISPDDEDNLVAALEHPGRVRHVEIFATCSPLQKVATVMRESFPALTYLRLALDLGDVFGFVPVIPDGFLGGSAPRLQHLRLEGVSFPELPAFLLSAGNLVTLHLGGISRNDYIVLEAMVGGLAVLTRLRTLFIGFDSETARAGQMRRRPDPPMRAILPALTQFHYRGYSDYLEDLVAQIDTPRVDDIRIEYVMEEQVQVSQFSRFIGRTANLKLAQFKRAQVTFRFVNTYIELDRPQGECRQAHLSLSILGPWLDLQVPCMAHLLGRLVAMLSNVGHLSVHGEHKESRARFDPPHDDTEWLPLLRLFPAVEALHVSGMLAGYIASALEDMTDEMVAEVLPALHLVLLDDNYDNVKPVGSTEKFLSLRQLSGRPVTIVNTRDEFFERLNAHRRR